MSRAKEFARLSAWRRNLSIQALSGDLFGGVTSAVVALPTALAFGVASGLGPIAGIYGAIAVGFFASVFGGTPSQISGPTGPMTVAMATIVTLHANNIEHAFMIVMLAGLLQMVLGALRIGTFVSYTPYSVISGFMSGVGCIIITLQVIPFVGADPATGGTLSQIAAWPEAIGNLNPDGLVVGTIALAICIFWPRRWARFAPSPLVALVTGTLAALFWFTGAKTIGDIPAGWPSIHLPRLSWDLLISFVEPALIIALLGSIDSLLTSLVADSLTHTRHNPNKELVGQGLGNLAAGFLGALPGAGATMGTVTSIRAGGRSPLAGALRAIILLALLLGAGPIAEPVPLAVLAGILLKVGWDIVDWRFILRIRRIRREYVLVMLITFSLTVFVDLITAVALGLIASGVVRSKRSEHHELDRVTSVPLVNPAFFGGDPDIDDMDPYRMPVGLVMLRGGFSVASSNELTRAVMKDIEDHDIVILDFSKTTSVDDSAALAIEQLIDAAKDGDTVCIVLGLKGRVAEVLHSLMILRQVRQEHFVDSLDGAISLSKSILDERRAA